MANRTPEDDLYQGLIELADASFPKRCNCCGRVYATAAEFIAATRAAGRNGSGLKQGYDDHDLAVVELFRNCPCGSTLMGTFGDRRDISADGGQRRHRFDQVAIALREKGLDEALVRTELLLFMRGQPNQLGQLIEQAPPSAIG